MSKPETPAKQLAAMLQECRAGAKYHNARLIEGYGVRLSISTPPRVRRVHWTIDGKRIGFEALLDRLERDYRINHPTAPAASKGLTFTAMDLGRALYRADCAPRLASAAGCADICSYITRVLFGRNLMMGRGPVRVNLENGHHLEITLKKDEV